MKQVIFLVLVLTCCVFTTLVYAQTSWQEHLKAVVEAERAFAKLSETQGIHDAFMTYLAEDSTVFRPRPTSGRPAYEKSANVPKALLWWPIFADAALSGDIGYTTGPWEYRNEGKGEPTGYGQYVTIWKKQADGSWRVRADIGIGHPKSDNLPTKVSFPENVPGDLPQKIDAEAARAAIAAADQAFLTASMSDGIVSAFQAYAAQSVRLYRVGLLPLVGLEASMAELSKKPGYLTWKPEVTEVAQSGELGFSYRIAEFRSEKTAADPEELRSYLRIWKRQPDGKWKIVLDIATVIPPGK
jgi:ketosteroid isomerase-like protein